MSRAAEYGLAVTRDVVRRELPPRLADIVDEILELAPEQVDAKPSGERIRLENALRRLREECE